MPFTICLFKNLTIKGRIDFSFKSVKFLNIKLKKDYIKDVIDIMYYTYKLY